MQTLEQYPCFGLTTLGMCSYNPSQPTSIYFSLGDGIAALGFMIVIQQFMRPIYAFRLRAYGVQLWHLIALIFCGFVCVFIAALLPNIPSTHSSFISYPITWEMIGAILISAAYGITAFISLRPAHVFNWSLIYFVRAAAYLLSKADDVDRVGVAEDLSKNLPRLIEYADAWELAENNAIGLEFERLREIGAPLTIAGRPTISPFYKFTHREELKRASYVGSFLQIIADPHFCAALVKKCPWLTAAMIRDISERHSQSRQAARFIQEVAHQALVSDESMMAREVDYSGFGSVPLLSESLFGNWFMLRHYDPLRGLIFNYLDEPAEGYIERLNSASEMIFSVAIKEKDYWPQGYIFSVEKTYESLFSSLSSRRAKGLSADFMVKLLMGVSKIQELTIDGLEHLEKDRRKSLFNHSKGKYRNDLVHSVASISYDCFASIANSFKGYGDDGWIMAIQTFMMIYPSDSSEPVGMNPLQQQLAVMLIDKLNENMIGRYPAISRVLLAVVGPYDSHSQIPGRTAYVIFKDAVYGVLQKLPELYAKNNEKIGGFLPDNVTYDPVEKSLTHTYSGGSTKTTNLSELAIPEVNFFDESNWRI